MLASRFERGTIVKCKIDGCLRPTMIRKHGLCRGHYMRWYEGRPMDGPIRKQKPVQPFKGKKS